MTLDSNSPWMIAQGAQPTIPTFNEEDLGNLCAMWIREPQLFRRAMPHLDSVHFMPSWRFEYIFTVLCIAERQYGRWTESILIELIRQQAQARAEPLMPGHLEQLTSQAEGGFVHDAIASGPLSATEMEHAAQLQNRFLVEKTVFQPLRNFVNPGRMGLGQRPENVDEFLDVVVQQQRRLQVHSMPDVQSVQDMWQAHEQQLEQFRGRRMVGLETGLSSLDQHLMGLRGVSLLGAAPGGA